MRILHYFLGFPPAHGGGLFVYVDSLSRWQAEKGHDVALLFPGRYRILKKACKITFVGVSNKRKIYEMLNPLPVSIGRGVSSPREFMLPLASQPFEDFLASFRPDIIHLHSLIGLPREFVEVAKVVGVPVILTTHDYFGLCPKVNFFSYKGEICRDLDWHECPFCNQNAPSTLHLKVLRSLTLHKAYPFIASMYRMAKKLRLTRLRVGFQIDTGGRQNCVVSVRDFLDLRDYYLDILKHVDAFHFNSSIARTIYVDYLKRFGIDPRGEIIHITHDRVKDNRHVVHYAPLRDGKVSITFLGSLAEHKGFPVLVRVLERIKMEGYVNWELNVYSPSKANLEAFDPNYFKFFGAYGLQDQQRIFTKTSLLVLPSVWYETFGFVGLEALSFGIPCLVAKNVGFTDLIESGKTGLVYDGSEEDLKAKIESVLADPSILERVQRNIKMTKYDFDFDTHGKNVMAFYEGCKNLKQKL